MAKKSVKSKGKAKAAKPAKKASAPKADVKLSPAEAMVASFGLHAGGDREKLLKRMVANVGSMAPVGELARTALGAADSAAKRKTKNFLRRFEAKIKAKKLKLEVRHDEEKDTYGLYKKA